MSERVTDEMVEAGVRAVEDCEEQLELDDRVIVRAVVEAALAARPASAEPVAKQMRHRYEATLWSVWYEWTPEKDAWAASERETYGTLIVETRDLYTTPPAAAQDREDAERFRALREAGPHGMCTIYAGYQSQYWSGPIADGVKGGLMSLDKYADHFRALNAARAAGATDGK